jgi:L-serine/L-threonine ammonia-lyase
MTVHVATPTVRSTPLSAAAGADVWLKLENVQPSGSFKLRGMGLAAARAAARGATGLVSSSGGNAGLAVAVAGRSLGLPVVVVVPSTTGAAMIARLRAEGAEVRVEGSVWDEAHVAATDLASRQGAALMHPFDDPDVWEGHATLVAEAATQAPRPDVVIVSVGGGGLLCGVARGLEEIGWSDVPIVAAETEGAASYAAALAAGRPVEIPAITSVATSLGARRVCEQAVAWSRERPIRSFLCTDAQALAAARRFADDHRMLVEPACGAALAAVGTESARGRCWVVVCGGAAVTIDSSFLSAGREGGAPKGG